MGEFALPQVGPNNWGQKIEGSYVLATIARGRPLLLVSCIIMSLVTSYRFLCRWRSVTYELCRQTEENCREKLLVFFKTCTDLYLVELGNSSAIGLFCIDVSLKLCEFSFG